VRSGDHIEQVFERQASSTIVVGPTTRRRAGQTGKSLVKATAALPKKHREEEGMTERTHPVDARILIVDDEAANVRLLERILEQGGYYNVVSTTDPLRVPELLEGFSPDLLLLDLRMPGLDGFAIMQHISATQSTTSFLPVLALTADISPETRRRALAGGARDFLTKPLDVDEVLLRIANMLDIRFLQLRLQEDNDELEYRVRERTVELEESYIDTFERLALAAEYRDDDTGQHTKRVGRMASILAAELGLPTDDVGLLERAAGLHDVGKIGVPDNILLAPRKLTREEFDVVKTHTTIGARILSGSRSPLLNMAEEIAWSHHERWDGNGYAGVEGVTIPITGRVTTVVDVFDALTHARPYKGAWPLDEAIAEIRRQRGSQFDPDIVDAFLKVVDRLSSVVLSSDVTARDGPPGEGTRRESAVLIEATRADRAD
jgi:cyclic di-GMP phosphodiesterase